MTWAVGNGNWQKPSEKRDAAILARWLQLKNFAAVGREFGLKRERIRQIVRRFEREERRAGAPGRWAALMIGEHRWSGWPGAWCLDCGIDDPIEIALADGTPLVVDVKIEPCPCPGEGKFDPYKKGSRP